MKYIIDVIGITWEGRNASYSKTFMEQIAPEKIKSEFGDFQEITDYRVTATEITYHVEGNKRITTRTEETISPFADSDGEFNFLSV